MENDKIRHVLLRIGVALIFVSFGMWEIVQPSYWIAFVPKPIAQMVSPSLFINLHGLLLLIIGLGILTGTYLRISAMLAVLVMISIIASLWYESGFSDIIIRDMVVLIAALALVFDDTNYLRLRK